MAATTASGRAVFYPGGKKPTQPPKTKPQVMIGGFENMSTAKRHGVSHESHQKADGWFSNNYHLLGSLFSLRCQILLSLRDQMIILASVLIIINNYNFLIRFKWL